MNAGILFSVLNRILLGVYSLLDKLASFAKRFDVIDKKLADLRSGQGDLSNGLLQIQVAIPDVQNTLGAIETELLEQRTILQKILAAVEPLPAVRFVFDAVLEGQILIGVTTLQITDSQKFTASIKPVDAKNNPATVDGIPVWTSSDATILTVTPAADGMSAEVAAFGPVGSANVAVSADADLGAGVTTITGTLQVDVVAGSAVNLQITAGAPVEQ